MESDFDSFRLSPQLLAVVGELGYDAPTAIQTKSIPVLLEGQDLIGQSKTGSGKTAAFALPILQKLSLENRELQALVVCPTRELTAQVARELRKLGRRHPGLQVLVVSGGEQIRPQRSALERGVHIVVGTPGRLLDHLKRGSLSTSTISTVVLDEADRMLDMGFQAEVESILAALPAERQTVFFSATFPSSIEAMSRAHQRDAVRVTIEDDEPAMPVIRQLSVTAEPREKLHALLRVLNAYAHESALIFCNFKKTVAELSRNLAASGLSVDCLHGDLDQFDRDQVLAKFRNQSVRILIATDVAGRGLDVEDLDLVINYELPDHPDIYVHRIGRTGRAGRTGLAVSLAAGREKVKLEAIQEVTGTPIERITVETEADLSIIEVTKAIAVDAKMDTILISGGRKDKVRPGDILGALTGEAGGLDGADIGKIEIHDRFAYVAVSKPVSRAALKSLNSGRIKGKRFRASFVRNGRRSR